MPLSNYNCNKECYTRSNNSQKDTQVKHEKLTITNLKKDPFNSFQDGTILTSSEVASSLTALMKSTYIDCLGSNITLGLNGSIELLLYFADPSDIPQNPNYDPKYRAFESGYNHIGSSVRLSDQYDYAKRNRNYFNITQDGAEGIMDYLKSDFQIKDARNNVIGAKWDKVIKSVQDTKILPNGHREYINIVEVSGISLEKLIIEKYGLSTEDGKDFYEYKYNPATINNDGDLLIWVQRAPYNKTRKMFCKDAGANEYKFARFR